MKTIIVGAISCTIFLAACKKNGVTLTPAQAIEGSYTAYKHLRFDSVTSYPINGKTITMQIDAIGEDSVRLQIRSVQNGFFSPGDTVIDRHLFVQKVQSNAYQVWLGHPEEPTTADNSIWFDDSYNGFYPIYAGTGFYGYYTYVPTGYKQGAVQTAFKKMQ